ncbi:MAG: hypothetical protein ACI8QD_002755 [Cyclobacteriaceae bacterium]|jgi:hypothetical protein
MKINYFNSKPLILVFLSLGILFSSCETEEDLFVASVTLTEGDAGNIGGDFTGDGGTAIETFNWQNSLSTADYNADITASATGLFQMIVTDAEGNIVLDRTLNGSEEPDTFSGVTSEGVSGTWTVEISLTDFNGDGSFTLTEGD